MEPTTKIGDSIHVAVNAVYARKLNARHGLTLRAGDCLAGVVTRVRPHLTLSIPALGGEFEFLFRLRRGERGELDGATMTYHADCCPCEVVA